MRRKSAYRRADRMRRQKQRQEDRRQQALKLGPVAASMELKTSPDGVVREFGSWLGVHSQVVVPRPWLFEKLGSRMRCCSYVPQGWVGPAPPWRARIPWAPPAIPSRTSSEGRWLEGR